MDLVRAVLGSAAFWEMLLVVVCTAAALLFLATALRIVRRVSMRRTPEDAH
jgi:hypothetical protein